MTVKTSKADLPWPLEACERTIEPTDKVLDEQGRPITFKHRLKAVYRHKFLRRCLWGYQGTIFEFVRSRLVQIDALIMAKRALKAQGSK